jgi:hypothetical protein
MVDLVLQFALELIRALLVDELSKRVRSRVNGWFLKRDCRQIVLRLHRRNRDRLLNKLLTELRRDL